MIIHIKKESLHAGFSRLQRYIVRIKGIIFVLHFSCLVILLWQGLVKEMILLGRTLRQLRLSPQLLWKIAGTLDQFAARGKEFSLTNKFSLVEFFFFFFLIWKVIWPQSVTIVIPYLFFFLIVPKMYGTFILRLCVSIFYTVTGIDSVLECGGLLKSNNRKCPSYGRLCLLLMTKTPLHPFQ